MNRKIDIKKRALEFTAKCIRVRAGKSVQQLCGYFLYEPKIPELLKKGNSKL